MGILNASLAFSRTEHHRSSVRTFLRPDIFSTTLQQLRQRAQLLLRELMRSRRTRGCGRLLNPCNRHQLRNPIRPRGLGTRGRMRVRRRCDWNGILS